MCCSFAYRLFEYSSCLFLSVLGMVGAFSLRWILTLRFFYVMCFRFSSQLLTTLDSQPHTPEYRNSRLLRLKHVVLNRYNTTNIPAQYSHPLLSLLRLLAPRDRTTNFTVIYPSHSLDYYPSRTSLFYFMLFQSKALVVHHFSSMDRIFEHRCRHYRQCSQILHIMYNVLRIFKLAQPIKWIFFAHTLAKQVKWTWTSDPARRYKNEQVHHCSQPQCLLHPSIISRLDPE